MSEADILVLELHMPRLSAKRQREKLEEMRVKIDVEDYRQLILAETEDPEAAQEMATKYADELLRANDKDDE